METITTMETMATTISLDPETKEMLRDFGRKGETYDDILQRLLEEVGWKRLDERWNRILEEDEFIPLEDL